MLTDLERALLDTAEELTHIPRTHWPAHVAAQHGNDILFWQQVNVLLETREAAEYAPRAVAWLRRIRDTGRRSRRRLTH
jgi:hypothetical protein